MPVLQDVDRLCKSLLSYIGLFLVGHLFHSDHIIFEFPIFTLPAFVQCERNIVHQSSI